MYTILPLAFHTYNLLGSSNGEDEHKKFTTLSENKLNVPIWNEEIAAHTAEWIGSFIDMFENPTNNIGGWIFRPWTRVPESANRYRHLMGITSSTKWNAVRNWIADGFGFAPRSSREKALAGMQEFLQSMKAENLSMDTEIQKIITGFSDVQPIAATTAIFN